MNLDYGKNFGVKNPNRFFELFEDDNDNIDVNARTETETLDWMDFSGVFGNSDSEVQNNFRVFMKEWIIALR